MTVLFVLLEFASPSHDVKFLFITYPAHTNVLLSLISFGVSGIYLSFLLTVIGAIVARAKGWIPAGRFRLGKWAWPVTVAAALYLAIMLTSPRGDFNYDWITLLVMFVIAVVGLILFLLAHRGREIGEHLRDDLETSPASRASRAR